MKQQPKISLPEAFLLTAYIALTDVVGIVLVLFALDDFFIIDAMTFPVTQIYFRMKGVSKAGLDLTMNLAEVIPYVGALPLRTIGVIMVIWADHHPAGVVAQVTQKAAQVTSIKNPKGALVAKTSAVK